MGSLEDSPFLETGGNLMTIMEAISRIDEVKPNSCSLPEKIRWLSTLDGVIKTQIIDTHEDGLKINFEGYKEDCDLSINLIVPAPYDDIYLRWLEAQIDYTNGEYGKYNNSLTAFNDTYSQFEKYYNRTHMPKSKGNRFKF